MMAAVFYRFSWFLSNAVSATLVLGRSLLEILHGGTLKQTSTSYVFENYVLFKGMHYILNIKCSGQLFEEKNTIGPA